jgi:low temperature requirement protein LtrA
MYYGITTDLVEICRFLTLSHLVLISKDLEKQYQEMHYRAFLVTYTKNTFANSGFRADELTK